MTPNPERRKSPEKQNGTKTDSKKPDDEDEEEEEWAKLRCTSVQTEELTLALKEKEARRQRSRRCADYPGLAFGSAMFGSDTMMKFNIIKNELHNIMRSQLKRVDGEVTALSDRVKALDEGLEQSQKYINTATTALAEAVQYQIENGKDDEDENDALSQFDAQLKLLEGKLVEARLLAKASADIQ